MSENILQVKNKYGHTINTAPITYKGETLGVPVPFVGINDFIGNIGEFKTRPDDVWIISYVKSGTHWMHELIKCVKYGKTCSEPKEKSMLEYPKAIDWFDDLPSPRLMNTHIPLRRLSDGIQQSKIVYVARNPLSAALSYYHQGVKMKHLCYTGTIETFIECFSAEIYSFYGTWFDHIIDAYKLSKAGSNVLMMYYEEMREDPEKAVQQLSDFFGCDLTPERRRAVVEETSMQTMRERFKQKTDVTGKTEDNSHFIRKGETAEWKKYLSKEALDGFMEVYNEKLKDYPEIVKHIKI